GIELQHVRGQSTSEAGNARTLEGSGGDDDGSARNDIAVVQLCEEMLLLPHETRDPVAGDDGPREGCGVALEVVAHLILAGITALVALMGEPRQGADTSGREEGKGIEPPAPRVADSGMALLHDTRYPAFRQRPGGGKPGLAGTHNQYVYHPSCGSKSLATQHDTLQQVSDKGKCVPACAVMTAFPYCLVATRRPRWIKSGLVGRAVEGPIVRRRPSRMV